MRLLSAYLFLLFIADKSLKVGVNNALPTPQSSKRIKRIQQSWFIGDFFCHIQTTPYTHTHTDKDMIMTRRAFLKNKFSRE